MPRYRDRLRSVWDIRQPTWRDGCARAYRCFWIPSPVVGRPGGSSALVPQTPRCIEKRTRRDQ